MRRSESARSPEARLAEAVGLAQAIDLDVVRQEPRRRTRPSLASHLGQPGHSGVLYVFLGCFRKDFGGICVQFSNFRDSEKFQGNSWFKEIQKMSRGFNEILEILNPANTAQLDIYPLCAFDVLSNIQCLRQSGGFRKQKSIGDIGNHMDFQGFSEIVWKMVPTHDA